MALQTIHQLIRSGSPTTDDGILDVARSSVLTYPAAERRALLKQLELSLDGYGGALSQRADRVRTVLITLEAEMLPANAQ